MEKRWKMRWNASLTDDIRHSADKGEDTGESVRSVMRHRRSTEVGALHV